MKVQELLVEGGWASTVTQNTVITPKVVEAAMKVVAKFARDFNAYSKKKRIPPIRIGHPTGSTAYYKVDPPEKEYGDIDLQIIVPRLPEHEGKTQGQIQTFWNQTWQEFVDSQRPNYVHPDTTPGKPIFKINDDQYVQVDLMPHAEDIADWARWRTTPERGVKGLIRGNLFSVLGNLMNMNLQHQGVVYKIRDGVKMPYSTTLKNYKLVTLSLNIETYARDIFEHEFKLARGRAWTKKDPVHAMLVSNPGENIKDIKVENNVKAIIGLAKSFTMNDLYGLGDLTKYNSEDEFLDEFLRVYEGKARKDIESNKRDKAATPQAIARAERDKHSIQAGLQYVKSLFAQYR